MNWALALAQRDARAAGEHMLYLADNGERNFFRRLHPKIKAGGREESGVNRNSDVEQIVQELIAPFSRTDQTNVTKIQWEQCLERGKISPVIVRFNKSRRPRVCLNVESGGVHYIDDNPSE